MVIVSLQLITIIYEQRQSSVVLSPFVREFNVDRQVLGRFLDID